MVRKQEPTDHSNNTGLFRELICPHLYPCSPLLPHPQNLSAHTDSPPSTLDLLHCRRPLPHRSCFTPFFSTHRIHPKAALIHRTSSTSSMTESTTPYLLQRIPHRTRSTSPTPTAHRIYFPDARLHFTGSSSPWPLSTAPFKLHRLPPSAPRIWPAIVLAAPSGQSDPPAPAAPW